MRDACDNVLNLRLPASMRAALDGKARADGVRLSVATRNALALGLAAFGAASTPDNDPPPPAGPAARRLAA